MTTAQLIALIRKHPIGFLCGFISLACLLALYFRGDLIEAAQQEADQQAAQAARSLVNIRNATNLPEQLAEAQAMTKELDARLMRAGQLAANLQYFYKLETENEVKLLDLRQGSLPAAKGPKKNYVGIPYGLAIQGSYQNVIKFLTRLETGRHICRFNSIAFNKVAGLPQGEGMSVTINIDLLGTP